MKKLIGSLLGSILLLSNTAVAQTPVEFYGCKLNDGKSMSDVMEYVDKWNSVLDEIGADQHQAWIMAPQFSSDMNSWDFMWVGAWSDYDVMGQDIKNYFASKKASKLDENWPAECEMHTLWMSRQIREASGQ